MAVATVKNGGWYKGPDGTNAGQLKAGDVLHGSATSVFNFYMIVRAGKEIRVNGTYPLVSLTVRDDPVPPPPPPPPPPSSTKVGFALKVIGFKQFVGELEKE